MFLPDGVFLLSLAAKGVKWAHGLLLLSWFRSNIMYFLSDILILAFL